MFEWLNDEIRTIKTNKFHLVDGPANDELRSAVEKSQYPLPPSYKEFVLRFGNVKLYRELSYYKVIVFAGPRQCENKDGETLIQFGETHTSWAYFKESLLKEDSETPVFEWSHTKGLQQTANGFAEWLFARCSAARAQYTKREWQRIEHGPPPFNGAELAIVAARKQFHWRVTGVAGNGDLKFEVRNDSPLILPFLTIGIRVKDCSNKKINLNGGAWLQTSTLLPGETVVIEKNCYKDLVPPQDIEAFEMPDPAPEDRDRYWEFKHIP